MSMSNCATWQACLLFITKYYKQEGLFSKEGDEKDDVIARNLRIRRVQNTIRCTIHPRPTRGMKLYEARHVLHIIKIIHKNLHHLT